MKVYTGIGSRETPEDVLTMMQHVAAKLALEGWILRSGCAPGADSAFEYGSHIVADARELYLPWPSFGGRADHMVRLTEPTAEAHMLTSEFHPAWERLTQGAQKLHARNAHQVCGPNVFTPILSRFVICWTPEGRGGGGTGQALRIARRHGVPIYDLATDDAREKIGAWLT